MKICTLCKQNKSKLEFGKHSQKKDGLSSWCKECARKKANSYTSDKDVKKRKQAYDKQRYKENSHNIREKRKAYYYDNIELSKEKVRQWQKDNPEKTNTYKKNNKYKRREIINQSNLTAAALRAWEDSQYKICSYCGTGCSIDYQIDHIEPLTTGGGHEVSNLTISCPTCNRSKSNSPLIIWMAKRQPLEVKDKKL